jgi:hypothetical protein
MVWSRSEEKRLWFSIESTVVGRICGRERSTLPLDTLRTDTAIPVESGIRIGGPGRAVFGKVQACANMAYAQVHDSDPASATSTSRLKLVYNAWVCLKPIF